MEFILGAMVATVFWMMVNFLERRSKRKLPSNYILTSDRTKKLAEAKKRPPKLSETVPPPHGKTVKVFIQELSQFVDVSEEIVNQEGIVRLLLPNPDKIETLENIDFANLKPGYILTPFRVRRNEEGMLEAVRIG